jgi:hypothetical protein
MKSYSAGRPEAENAHAQIERLCAMLRHGGAMVTDTPSARVISGLANAGVFRLGAVLVGTHAFIALGNLLGVRWESNRGATLVNVPDPARFALHKLIVNGRRQLFEQVNAGKNRQQASEIIATLHEDRRGDLRLAVAALNKRSAVWRARLRRELAKLPEETKAAREVILCGLAK